MQLRFFFGIKPKTVEADAGKSFWNRTNTALPVFDENFDLSPEENQQKISDLCDELVRSKHAASTPKIDCPIKALASWARAVRHLPFPIPRHLFNETAIAYSKLRPELHQFRIIDGQVRSLEMSLQVHGVG